MPGPECAHHVGREPSFIPPEGEHPYQQEDWCYDHRGDHHDDPGEQRIYFQEKIFHATANGLYDDICIIRVTNIMNLVASFLCLSCPWVNFCFGVVLHSQY